MLKGFITVVIVLCLADLVLFLSGGYEDDGDKAEVNSGLIRVPANDTEISIKSPGYKNYDTCLLFIL